MSLEVVTRIRAKYPTPLGNRHGDFLEETAIALSLGLVQKNWGTFVLTRDGVGVSQDCLMAHGGHHWDILVDGEGSASPAFELVQDAAGPIILPDSRYIAPKDRGFDPGPTPEPEPDPDGDWDEDIDRILTALEGIYADLDEIEGDVDHLVERQDRLEADTASAGLAYGQEQRQQNDRLNALESRLNRPIRTEPTGIRPFSHSHEVKL